MSQHDTCGFSTLAIHAGKIKDAFGALTPPIYQTSTFEFESCQHGGDIFAGKRAGYAYSRTANPTVMAVEQKVAAMEGGEAALATSSGMGAPLPPSSGPSSPPEQIPVFHGQIPEYLRYPVRYPLAG